jgi:hypothetical protein
MSLFLVMLSAVLALGSIGLASSAHHSSSGPAHRNSALVVCPTPAPGDDLLGGQPSRC